MQAFVASPGSLPLRGETSLTNHPLCPRPAPGASFVARRSLASGRSHSTPTSTSTVAAAPTMALPFARGLSVAAAAALLALVPVHDALAARGGGRVGGSSFRAPSAPSRSYSAPTQRSHGGGGYGVGGGFGYGGGGMYMAPSLFYSPMLMPVGVGGGLGGLGGVVMIGAAGALAYRVLREGQEEREFAAAVNPDTAVVTVKVGLLATARQLQVDLDSVARSADTGSVRGLRYVLEEAVLSLLRNPDRWVYGSVETQVGKFSEAEDTFNRACMKERLKLAEETLTSVKGQRVERARRAVVDPMAVGEYIVVSLVCAATDAGLSKALPRQIDSASDLNRVLGMLGGVSQESLQGVEIIWAPQDLMDSLSEKEMLEDHPELRRI